MRVLLCTLGGSTQPIETMLDTESWDYVVFVCTAAAPGEGSPGSSQSTGKLASDYALKAWRNLIVPPDHLDGVFTAVIETIDDIRRTNPKAELVADYTGGTKSMSVGLAQAALSRPGIRLQNTTGKRPDLVKVANGTETVTEVAVERILVERQMEALTDLWDDFSYENAAIGFKKLRDDEKRLRGSESNLYAELHYRTELSTAFAAWDRFEHGAARDILVRLGRSLPKDRDYPRWAGILGSSPGDAGVKVSAVIDLLHNARRCAERKRFDDAVARLYRMWEATAQWLLWQSHGYLSDGSNLPDDIKRRLTPVPSGKYELGSERAWSLLKDIRPEGISTRFWSEYGPGGRRNQQIFRDHRQIRNHSILAHGTIPIGESAWKRIHDWTAGPFLKMIQAEAAHFGEDINVPQLPRKVPPRVI